MSEKEAKIRDPRLVYHPLKDTIVILVSLFLMGLVIFLSFALRPKGNSVFVEIKYGNTYLWEETEAEKSFSFPNEGTKKVSLLKTDGKKYIGQDFDFVSESVTFTLYSDRSIEILYEDISCPDHTCTRQGRIYDTYQPIVCLPNKVQMQIVTKEKQKAGEWDA